MKPYADFIKTKTLSVAPSGLESDSITLSETLFPFQRDLVRWALRRGRAAVFADTGLGKTLMELEWAHRVPGNVLIVAPLAVSIQTFNAGTHFGYDIEKFSKLSPLTDNGVKRIVVTNYEKLPHIDTSFFQGVALDESSILKNSTGKLRNTIIEQFKGMKFKLACSATPAPNDYMELGSHAEFLGICKYKEMLARFFLHDTKDTKVWRLKKHGRELFWAWMAEWAAFVSHPRDLGYEDDRYDLPPLTVDDHIIPVEVQYQTAGELFPETVVNSLNDQRRERKRTIKERVERAIEICEKSEGQVLIWVEYNAESKLCARSIPGAKEITGSMPPEEKARLMIEFANGEIKVLVTKPKIAGFGLNWQNCSEMIFFGLSHSYEQYYQCVRRCYRFGQEKPVMVHRVFAESEMLILQNLTRKIREHEQMKGQVSTHMAVLTRENVKGIKAMVEPTHNKKSTIGNDFAAYNDDCVTFLMESQPDDSIDYSICSPPFSSLYLFSGTPMDMGNVVNHEQFFEHFTYLLIQMLRVTKPGRLFSIHCMNIITTKAWDDQIGIFDFRGEIVRHAREAGWIYHSEVFIDKDPVVAAVRTKSIGLLHKQLKKDSTLSRQGLADYIVTLRKPGVNAVPVGHRPDDFPVDLWRKWAAPVWNDINQQDVLEYRSAKDNDDEKHITPLQLEPIRRCIRLWSNPGDVVLSPFMGIGSEGYVALQEGRKFIGVELKESYYRVACKNLAGARAQTEMELVG